MEMVLVVLLIIGVIIFVRKFIVDKIGKVKYQIICFNLCTIIAIIAVIINPEIILSLFRESLPVIIFGIIMIAFVLFIDIWGIISWKKGKFDD